MSLYLTFRSLIVDLQSSILNPQSSILSRVRHPEEAVPPVYAREDLLAARFRVTKVLPFQHAAPFISNLSLAVFSGLLLVFAFPDWNLWSLGWVGTAPLIMAVVRERKFWRSLLLGMVTGTIFFAGSSHWVTYSMHNYGGISLWLCYIILIVFSATLGVFTGVFAAALALAHPRLPPLLYALRPQTLSRRAAVAFEPRLSRYRRTDPRSVESSVVVGSVDRAHPEQPFRGARPLRGHRCRGREPVRVLQTARFDLAASQLLS
jgi:hypothetical protein